MLGFRCRSSRSQDVTRGSLLRSTEEYGRNREVFGLSEVRIPEVANNLYYWLNKEKRVKRKEEEKKGDERKKRSADAKKEQGKRKRSRGVTRDHSN